MYYRSAYRFSYYKCYYYGCYKCYNITYNKFFDKSEYIRIICWFRWCYNNTPICHFIYLWIAAYIFITVISTGDAAILWRYTVFNIFRNHLLILIVHYIFFIFMCNDIVIFIKYISITSLTYRNVFYNIIHKINISSIINHTYNPSRWYKWCCYAYPICICIFT